MNLVALAVEVTANEIVKLGAIVFNFDCEISPYWINTLRKTPWTEKPDFAPEELNFRLGEFLTDYNAQPAVFASAGDWYKYVFPDEYLQLDERWLKAEYSCNEGVEQHLDAIMDAVRAEKYKWMNR